MSQAKTQDLPPPGGYEKIRFKRVPAKTLFTGFQAFGIYLGKKRKFVQKKKQHPA
jgi:hypothetical protein